MEMRRIGASDLTVSAIGFGTWPIGGARYGASDDRQAIRAIQAALDLGVTCFDTAPSYGNGHAEELLAKALGPRRDEAVIVTKGGLIWDDRSHVLGRDSRRGRLEEVLDGSLRRLGTDYVDLYLVHWPDPSIPVDEVAGALESFVSRGKARAIGVSNFSGAQLRHLAAAMGPVRLAASQVSFSLFDRRWADDAFGACRDLGVGVMAYGPLAHGLLAGAITRETVFDETDWRAAGVMFGQSLLTPENRDQNLAVVDRLRVLAGSRGATLAQVAIAWVLRHDPVAVALVGARDEQEITDATGASTLRLANEDVSEIERLMAEAVGMSTVLPT